MYKELNVEDAAKVRGLNPEELLVWQVIKNSGNQVGSVYTKSIVWCESCPMIADGLDLGLTVGLPTRGGQGKLPWLDLGWVWK